MSEIGAYVKALTPGEAGRYLYRIAESALDHYPVGSAQLTFLGRSGGASFRVEPRQGRSPLLLKIHIHSPREREVIESGLQWLAALHRDTDVTVQVPVLNVRGAYVTEIHVPDEMDYSVCCSLVRWVEGERCDGAGLPWTKTGAPLWRECHPVPITPEWAGRLGTMVAKLHRHASQWELPTGFTRPKYGARRMYAWLRDLRPFVRAGRISAGDLAVLEGAAERVRALMAELGEGGPRWGLVHADLCPDNYVFYRDEVRLADEVRPLDFDLCGFSYYELDIAYVFLWQSPGNRRAFLRGYERVRRLPGDHPSVIEAFYVWGVIAMMKFWAPHPALVERTCKRYLRGEPFLFQG